MIPIGFDNWFFQIFHITAKSPEATVPLSAPSYCYS